ncbi:hypothetical protein [Flavobacterium sp. C3NV]|uniref:hypothetical protein n=1 Tax=Flavobacterium sp. C3NV TaxID=3393358 RepID=UPI003990090E
MKKTLILIALIVFSCKYYKSDDNFCLKKIAYVNQRLKLIHSIIEIQIEDSNGILEKKLMSGKLKNVILYSVKESDRKYYYLTPFGTGKQFKIQNNLIIIPLITTLFEDDLGNKLSDAEIQEKIKGDVGLTFDKDTIIIKGCLSPLASQSVAAVQTSVTLHLQQ